MAADRRSLAPPYLVETYQNSREAYQSISFHPSYQLMSFEELRLKDYCDFNPKSSRVPVTAPNQMAFPLPVAFTSNDRRKSVRASPDAHHKLDDDVVVFLVGTSPPKKFTVHEGVVKPRSEFVRLALQGEWKEASERTIPLPEDDPAVFKVYQQWLYSSLVHSLNKTADSEFDEEYELLVKSYILGEKIMDPDFKDCVADALVEKVSPTQAFNPHLTSLVFDNTPSGSPLRRLWIDIHWHFGRPEWLGHITNVEFLVEFSRLQMVNRTGFDDRSLARMFSDCAYHGHGTSPCYREGLLKAG